MHGSLDFCLNLMKCPDENPSSEEKLDVEDRHSLM